MDETSEHLIPAARLRHDRWYARIGLLVTAVGTVGAPTVLAPVNPVAANWALVVGAVAGAQFALRLWLLRRGPHSAFGHYFQTLFELSLICGAVLIDQQLGAEFSMAAPGSHLFAVIVAASSLRLRPALCLTAGGTAAVMIIVLGVWVGPSDSDALFHEDNVLVMYRGLFLVLIGVVSATTCGALRLLLSSAHRQTKGREHAERAFGVYVPQGVVDQALAGDLALHTERRDITVMFVDIRSFTALSEKLPPGEVVERLNIALGAFARAIDKHGGMVNKYLGDGLMAVFGAPEPMENHPDAAARAAIDIVSEVDIVIASGAFPELRIGIGINSGDSVVGDVGDSERREYTAIGDTVNVAARIEGLTKTIGATILITEAVLERLGDEFETAPKGEHTVRNRDQPLSLHELVGRKKR